MIIVITKLEPSKIRKKERSERERRGGIMKERVINGPIAWTFLSLPVFLSLREFSFSILFSASLVSIASLSRYSPFTD